MDLTGQKLIVVGGTGGIGRALSRFLAAAGAHVIVVGQTFRDAGVPRIEFIQADLSLMESLVGLLTPIADAYAQHIAPLLVPPDLEAHSGALFERKGNPILPSAGLAEAHMQAFVAASEALLAKAGVSLSA